MHDIPDFNTALEQFRQFLISQGLPAEIVWVFRDDIWWRGLTDIWVKYPNQTENLKLAQKVFAEGRDRGLIQMLAIATVKDKVAATVWFPKFPNEEVQGWDRNMKLSIRQPLSSAKRVGALRWWYRSRLPDFRDYQENKFSGIGSKAWAAA